MSRLPSSRRARTFLCLVRALLANVVVASTLVVAGAQPALAASPSPAIGDVRTTTAPGLVGDPLFAVAGVVLVGIVALGLTLLYVRLSDPRRR